MWITLYQVGIFFNILVKIFLCNISEILANLHEKKRMSYLVALSLIKTEKVEEGDMHLPLCEKLFLLFMCQEKSI